MCTGLETISYQRHICPRNNNEENKLISEKNMVNQHRRRENHIGFFEKKKIMKLLI